MKKKDLLTPKAYNLASVVLVMGLSALAKRTIDSGFHKATGNYPPKNPEQENTSVGTVILYTAATAAAGVAVQILARKLLASQWKKFDGKLPDKLD
jgi:hypothetical protein